MYIVLSLKTQILVSDRKYAILLLYQCTQLIFPKPQKIKVRLSLYYLQRPLVLKQNFNRRKELS